MAILYTTNFFSWIDAHGIHFINKQQNVELAQPGVYYADAIKWKLTNDFYAKIKPGYYLKLEMQNTNLEAEYYGATTAKISRVNFYPDVFKVYKTPRGIVATEPDITQQQRIDFFRGIEDEAIQRDYKIHERTRILILLSRK